MQTPEKRFLHDHVADAAISNDNGRNRLGTGDTAGGFGHVFRFHPEWTRRAILRAPAFREAFGESEEMCAIANQFLR